MKKLSVCAKKAIATAALLLLSLTVCFIVSGMGKSLSDSEARELLSTLLTKETALNEVVFGDGLEPGDDSPPLESVTGAQYRTVKSDSPYTTKSELLAALSEVYTEEYIKDTLTPILFDGINGGNEALASVSGRYAETGGVLSVDITYGSNISLTYTADISSARVISGRVGYTTVMIELAGENGEKSTAKLELKKQNGEYLLSGSSYCKDVRD